MTAIHISDHAMMQLAERGLSADTVRETVGKPDEVVPGRGRRQVAHKLLTADQLFRVVYETEGETITIRVSKYWRGK